MSSRYLHNVDCTTADTTYLASFCLNTARALCCLCVISLRNFFCMSIMLCRAGTAVADDDRLAVSIWRSVIIDTISYMTRSIVSPHNTHTSSSAFLSCNSCSLFTFAKSARNRVSVARTSAKLHTRYGPSCSQTGSYRSLQRLVGSNVRQQARNMRTYHRLVPRAHSRIQIFDKLTVVGKRVWSERVRVQRHQRSSVRRWTGAT